MVLRGRGLVYMLPTLNDSIVVYTTHRDHCPSSVFMVIAQTSGVIRKVWRESSEWIRLRFMELLLLFTAVWTSKTIQS